MKVTPFTDKVILHNPHLQGLPVHTLLVLNHDQINHNTRPMEYWWLTLAWTSWHHHFAANRCVQKESVLSLCRSPKGQSSYAMCTLGWGVNEEGFNSNLAMVKMCSIWPLLNKCPFKKIWRGSSDPTITSDTPSGQKERPKFENLNFVFAIVKIYSQ